MKKILILLILFFTFCCNSYAIIIGYSRSEGAAPSGLLAELQCYQDNGEALDVGGENVTAVNITHGTGHDSVANASVVIDSNSDQYSFPCNETNGLIESEQGSIEFYYKHTGDISNGHMFAQSTANETFRLYRENTSNKLVLIINNSLAGLDLLSGDLFNGSWHKVLVTWDHSASERKLYFNDVLQDTVATAWTDAAITAGNVWIGNRSGAFASNAEFQDFKIYNTVIVP